MKWINSRPSYCDLDHEKRKLFFSKYLQCSHIELLILHKLCISWQREIPYTAFLHKIHRYSYNIEKILGIFLHKLERCGFALVRMAYNEYGRHVPEKIILSNHYDPFLVQMTIEEYYYRMQRNPKRPYLTREKLGIPEYFEKTNAHNITLAHLYTMHSNNFKNESKVDIIDIQDISIVLCARAFDYFYSATKCKFLVYMANKDMIAEIQKKYMQSIDCSTIQRYINNDEYKNTYKLTTHLLEHYARISGMPVSAQCHLFQALTILHHISKSEIEGERQALIKTTRFTHDFHTIYSAVRKAPNCVMAKDAYRLLLKKYYASWKDFFQDNVITLHTNSNAFPLLIAGDVVIHKDNIKPYLIENYQAARSAILNALITDVHERILSRDILVHMDYSSMSRVEYRIRHLLERMYPIIHCLLEYPQYYVSTALSAEVAIVRSAGDAEEYGEEAREAGVRAEEAREFGVRAEEARRMYEPDARTGAARAEAARTEQEPGVHTEAAQRMYGHAEAARTGKEPGAHTEEARDPGARTEVARTGAARTGAARTEQEPGVHTEAAQRMYGHAEAARTEEAREPGVHAKEARRMYEHANNTGGVHTTNVEEADDEQSTDIKHAENKSADRRPLSVLHAYKNLAYTEHTAEVPHISTETDANSPQHQYMHYYAAIFFDIDPLYVFLHACKKLSFMRRSLYTVSNEYDILRAHFSFLSTSVADCRRQHLPASSPPTATAHVHTGDTQSAEQVHTMWARMYYILWTRSKKGSNAA